MQEIEIKKYYYPSGKLRYENKVLNDKNHGKQTGYYQDSSYAFLGLQINDLWQKMYEFWNINNSRKYIDCDKNNQRHGAKIEFLY